ncbi:MAG: chitobiase/beta-hexosaminidase C-terminal domain-containing protein [Verrucomicrobiota bacterium]
MSINLLDVIDRLPTEDAARLASDPFFSDIPVIVADKGNVSAEVARAQGIVTMKSGKRGVCVVVLQLVGDDLNPNIPFGPMRLYPAFQVIEQVEMNNDKNGTKKSARRVARQIVKLIKTLRLVGVANSQTPDKPCIEPIRFKDADEKLIGYQVNFYCDESDSETVLKVANPVFAPRGGASATVTLTCATAGAAIWYTTDDTPPDPGVLPGSTAHLYASPITVPPAGVTIRACAYLAGSVASDVERFAFTAP